MQLAFTTILQVSSIYPFSSATLRARWTELNQNWPHTRKWVRFENVMSQIWGIPSLYKSREQKPPFSMSSQVNNFNGLYLRNETRYTQSGKCVANYKGFQNVELWSTNGLKLDSHFTHPPQILHSTSLPGFASSQTEISKRKSTKFCQTAGLNRANNLP